MNYNKLGNTDLIVRTICLGTMTQDEQNTIKEEFEQMDYTLNQVINFTQMSIKFCEIQKFITSAIIGATTMEQLKTNIESVKVNLDNEIIKEINEVQKIYSNPCP